MIGSTRRVTVHVYSEPCDMRKSFDALSALVTQHMRLEVTSGDVFLFVGRNRRYAKVLHWDGTGLCVYAKRLEKGLFAAPWKRRDAGGVTFTMSELALFLEGSELIGRQALSPAPFQTEPLFSKLRMKAAR